MKKIAKKIPPRPGRAVRGSTTGRPIMAALDLLGRRWTEERDTALHRLRPRLRRAAGALLWPRYRVRNPERSRRAIARKSTAAAHSVSPAAPGRRVVGP